MGIGEDGHRLLSGSVSMNSSASHKPFTTTGGMVAAAMAATGARQAFLFNIFNLNMIKNHDYLSLAESQ